MNQQLRVSTPNFNHDEHFGAQAGKLLWNVAWEPKDSTVGTSTGKVFSDFPLVRSPKKRRFVN